MDRSNLSRKKALGKLMALPALAATVVASPALAQGKVPKKVVSYKEKSPYRLVRCSKCMFFIPGKNPTANGSCSLVEGSISPEGVCNRFFQSWGMGG